MDFRRLYLIFLSSMQLSGCSFLIKYSEFKQEPASKSCSVSSSDGQISLQPMASEDIFGAGPMLLPIPWSFSTSASELSFLVRSANSSDLAEDVFDEEQWLLEVSGETIGATEVRRFEESSEVARVDFNVDGPDFKKFKIQFNGDSELSAVFRHKRDWSYLPLAVMPVSPETKCN